MEDTNLNEIFDTLQRYSHDDSVWDRFLQDEFFKYDQPTRLQVMVGFDKLMSQETRPNRTTAMWMNRQRELVAMHKNLERGGR